MSARSGPAFETSTRDGKDWRDDAACQSTDADGRQKYDPELWFPIGMTLAVVPQIIEAKRICHKECEVREDCLAFALAPATRQDHGIWGGMDEDTRRQHLRRQARARQALAKQGY